MKIKKILHLVLSHLNVSQHHTKTALFEAVEQQNVEQVKELLAKDSSYEAVNAIYQADDGVAPKENVFFKACETGNREIINLLLDTHEVNPNWTDSTNTTCFLEACEHCSIETIRDILEKSEPNLNHVNHSGRSVITTLASRPSFQENNGLIELIKELIEQGVNYQHIVKNENKIPFKTFYQNKDNIVQWRKKMIGEFEARNIDNNCVLTTLELRNGYNAFNCAIYAGNLDVISFFLSETDIDKTLSIRGRNAICDAVLSVATEDNSHIQKAKMLIDAGFDLNDMWIYLGSPLHENYKIDQNILDYAQSIKEKVHLDTLFSEPKPNNALLESKIQNFRKEKEVLNNSTHEDSQVQNDTETKINRKKI